MKWLCCVLSLFACAGCSGLPTPPSLEYCQSVRYERIGQNVKITAECTVPVGVAVK